MLFPDNCKIWLYSEPSDMRKAINGLTNLVVDKLEGNPQSGELFIFYNRNYDLIKILFWHYNGFCLLHKRLEKDKFKILRSMSGKVEVSEKQLYRLLEGLHFSRNTDEPYDIFF